MRLFAILLKHPGWQHALVKAWRIAATAPRRTGVQASRSTRGRAALIRRALQASCGKMQGADCAEFVDAIGQNLSFLYGPVAVMTRFSIAMRSPGGCLQIGSSSMKLLTGRRSGAQAISEISKWVSVADEINGFQAPRTCSEWCLAFARAKECILAASAMSSPRRHGYLLKWICKSMLLSLMARHGVPRLRGASDVSIKLFMEACPDSNGWLDKLSRPGFRRNMQRLCDDLDYTGPVEHLSMFTCLLLTPGMQEQSVAWYDARARVLRERMLAGRFMQSPKLAVKAQLGDESNSC